MIAQLDMLWSQLSIVEITAEVIDRAVVLADEHSLRGYDAVHLAAGLIAGSEVFTSADRKLCEAARASGLHVANPVETASEATAEVLSDLNEPAGASLITRSSGLFGVPIPAGAEPPIGTYWRAAATEVSRAVTPAPGAISDAWARRNGAVHSAQRL